MRDSEPDEWINIARRVSLVAAVVVVAGTLGRWSLAAGFGLGARPVGLVLVGAAVVVGRPARLGGAAGLLATGLLVGDWSGGVVDAIAAYVATVVAVRLWAREDDRREVGWAGWLLRYGAVAVGGVLVFASTGALLFDLLGRAPFSIAVRRTVTASLPLALLGAPLVRMAGERATGTDWSVPGAPVTGRSRRILLGTVVCWSLAGYVGSVLFRVIGLSPSGSLGRRIAPAFEAFVTVWGPQGVWAQLLLGLVALGVIAVVLRAE